jgi:hypothetical protein
LDTLDFIHDWEKGNMKYNNEKEKTFQKVKLNEMINFNDTPQNIYVRKSRLKKSLQELILEDPQMNFS